LVLTVELAKQSSGNDLVGKAVEQTVQRADEITELLAYYQLANLREGTKKLNRLSKQIQKGLAGAFNRFDEYQFAKYNVQAEVKLKDALFLVHPKAKNAAQQDIFNKIASNTLNTPYTWETALSALGQVKYATLQERKNAFAEKWQELIESGKLGYMALMRNLRNILESGVSAKHIDLLCQQLTDPKAVLNARQLPFRFLAAYRELASVASGHTSAVMQALEQAVHISASNIKGFDSETALVIACDVSGSMQKPVSAKSKILLYDIGLMLGMLLQSRSKNVISGMFGDRWKIINMPKTSVLSNVQEYYRREGEVGYSTNGYLVIEDLIARQTIVDKVMLFTDVQMWNSNGTNHTFARSWSDYKRLAPHAKLYLFDLAGYGNTPVDVLQNDVYLIAGWSDKVFDILHALEDRDNALNHINTMEI
ncbi:MAG: TROVE domain-containing protein, partial [Sphingobacteriales bacterium]